jgi:hypothetical protein
MNNMPFGKFAGQPISGLKDDYLQWLLGLDTLRDPLKSAVEGEVQKRRPRPKSNANNGKASPSLCPSPELAEEIVTIGLRRISQRLHGGDDNAVVLLNDTAKWMRAKAWGTH